MICGSCWTPSFVLWSFHRTSGSCTVSSVESPNPRRRPIKAPTVLFPRQIPLFYSTQETLASKNTEAGPSCCSHDGFQTSRITSISFILIHKLWCQILSCCQLNPFGLMDQNNQESFFTLPVFMNTDVLSFIYDNPFCVGNISLFDSCGGRKALVHTSWHLDEIKWEFLMLLYHRLLFIPTLSILYERSFCQTDVMCCLRQLQGETDHTEFSPEFVFVEMCSPTSLLKDKFTFFHSALIQHSHSHKNVELLVTGNILSLHVDCVETSS